MDIKGIIKRQYGACLEMLKQAIVKCPESLWDDQAYKNKFWHISYHVLFYTHLYLQDSEKDFTPWTKHRADHQVLDREPEIRKPYGKEEILDYLEICRKQVEEKVPSLNLDAESGFGWLPFDKMELQFYNIRHLQHHTGQLIDRLRTKENIEVKWFVVKP